MPPSPGHPSRLYAHARLDPQRSDAIRIARVICILSMISVHFWPGSSRILDGAGPDWASPFYMLVVDFLGRSSVPLLSMVSGALMVMTMRRQAPITRVISGKARGLLAPMVIWSAILLAVYLLHAAATGDTGRLPSDGLGWINALTGLTAPTVNLPLAFLRDTFLCATLTALALGLIPRVAGRATPVLLGAALIATLVAAHWLFLRPQIAWFYAAGLVLGLTGWVNRSLPWPIVLALVMADSAGRSFGLFPPEGQELLNRIAMSLTVWKLCEAIVAYMPATFAALRRVERYVFTLFCSHMLMVTVVAGIAQKLDLSERDDSYLLVFLLQYPAALALAWIIVRLRSPRQKAHRRVSPA